MVGQPFREAENLYDYFRDVTKDAAISRLRISVAWAKRSGLARIRRELESFRERGGEVTAIVGISEGGASSQGLSALQELSDRSYIFHDSHRTFHPKLYLADGNDRAEVFLGSNNLTAGGVYWNYELSVWMSLDLSAESDEKLYREIDGWFETLIADSDVCKPLDEELYSELVGSARYRIANEDVRSDREDAEPSVSDSVHEEDGDVRLFGRSRSRKKGDPLGAGLSASIPRPPDNGESVAAAPGTVPAERVEVIKRWHKKMSATDAQQPLTANSNITGHLKLTKASHSIDQKMYFRNDFFGDIAWDSIAKERGEFEKAIVSAEFVVNGFTHGIHDIVIDHAEYRVANQNNVPTWLHWNEYIARYLRSHNHVGDYVSLEKTAAGKYRLVVESELSGEFIK